MDLQIEDSHGEFKMTVSSCTQLVFEKKSNLVAKEKLILSDDQTGFCANGCSELTKSLFCEVEEFIRESIYKNCSFSAFLAS